MNELGESDTRKFCTASFIHLRPEGPLFSTPHDYDKWIFLVILLYGNNRKINPGIIAIDHHTTQQGWHLGLLTRDTGRKDKQRFSL